MITGAITANREATVRLEVRGPNGQQANITAVIDTGFTGFLTLLTALITTLGLPRFGRRQAILGDGNVVVFDVYEVTVIWDNQARDVLVLASDGDSLLGMSMFYGHRVLLEVVDGGLVTIEALP
jgi:clan AA aspartic protease